MKKKVCKGVMLVEVALCLMVNVPLLLGGLEFSWYLYIREGLAGAAGQAVRYNIGNGPRQSAQNYLIGLGFPDSFINSVNINLQTQNIPGSQGKKINSASISVPLTETLLFGGIPSTLIITAPSSTVSETAHMRD